LDWAIWNCNIEWTIQHLELIEDEIKWKFRKNQILQNPKIASNQKIVYHLFDRLNKKLLPENSFIVWNEDLLNKLSHKIEIAPISSRLDVPLGFLDKNRRVLNWNSLSWNTNIRWTIEFLEKYKDKLNWSLLSMNNRIPWRTN
jgi:hypothetical protein